MGIGVVDAVEDGVVVQQALEAADVEVHCDDDKKEGDAEGESSPRQFGVAATMPVEQAETAGKRDQHQRDDSYDDGDGEQPAKDELPCRQGEEEEVERSAEDGIDHAAGGMRRVYEEGKGGPIRHHGGTGDGRHHERSYEADDAQDGFDGEIDRLPAKQDGASAGQAGLAGALERGECTVEDDKGCHREEREDAPL